MTLAARIALRTGALALDVDLALPPGEVVAVLGPNGAGKTTLLRALAGLVPLDAGRIVLDGRVFDDPAAGVFVPPERRRVGVVFQDYLLFPHLTAEENVAFGLRAGGAGRAEARRRAREWLARVGLAGLEAVRPPALSGGQAQRVALARALAVEPALLLLDEPLAALDVGARAALRRDLGRHLRAFAGPRLLVTHDPLEAAALADRLVILEAGRIVQEGAPADVTARPRSRWVADLAGLNLLAGRARGDRVELDDGAVLAVPDAGDGAVLAVIHPRAVTLHRARPSGSPRNVWATRVAGVDVEGRRVRVRLAGPLPLVAEVTRAAADELRLQEGGDVWVAVKATEIATYPA